MKIRITNTDSDDNLRIYREKLQKQQYSVSEMYQDDWQLFFDIYIDDLQPLLKIIEILDEPIIISNNDFGDYEIEIYDTYRE
ncbi:hypothetical protein [uncultured Lactobacillus sp.]|uniref:hypothetical protein n=1 Tax=uncultured Lactobacillus sp. TaxID=153152 RepID=UPI002634D76B|nr:hypothetical protein [uncultured Lactobacillus sp.]